MKFGFYFSKIVIFQNSIFRPPLVPLIDPDLSITKIIFFGIGSRSSGPEL